ncbi:hypothetical protein [Lentzea californiensis]|uniref:hypothetical protein n=1 Tax=Lentzea californiensis TaxID=438851 RepID=UPI00216444A1|nr:hypothetical protein [Lentzea californiensis]MCR3747911.1 hypothetical protein [Lentzea californiensis]
MKRTFAVVAAAAALSLAFAPAAMAGGDDDHHHHYHGFHQTNGSLLSVLNGNNVNAVVGVCGNNVGVLGAAVPINSPSITETCAAGGIVDGDDVNVDG